MNQPHGVYYRGNEQNSKRSENGVETRQGKS